MKEKRCHNCKYAGSPFEKSGEKNFYCSNESKECNDPFGYIVPHYYTCDDWEYDYADLWFDCDNKLPSHEEIVLAYRSIGIDILQFTNGQFYHFEEGYVQDVTHWMNLPNIPK